MTATAGRPAVRRPSWFPVGVARGRIETKQFMRRRESVVFTLIFPLLLLFIFGSVFDDDIAPGVSFSQYFVAGMIASAFVNTGFQSLAIGISIERDNGALKRLAGTPMPRPSYFVGKLFMVVAVAVLQIALLLLGGVVAFDIAMPDAAGWLTFLWVGALGIISCTLCGIAFSSVPRDGESSPAIVTPIVIVLQFISGVFFVYASLPQWMQQVAALFPLKWLTQGMRSVFLPDTFATAEVTGGWELPKVALVLTLWCILALVLCLLTFRWQRRGED